MLIQICIGSACHLKGSYTIINYLQERIKQDCLENKITLKASFCLEKCSDAVSVKINEDPVISVSPDSIEQFFNNIIREYL